MMKFQILIVLAIGIVVLSASHLQAQNLSVDPLDAEVWKKSQSLNDNPSIDPTVITFSVGGVQYQVPRNFIVKMDNWNGGPQTLVAFKVTYPGFEPLKESTKDCLKLPPTYQPTGCMPVEFWIIGGRPVSDDETFHNASNLFHSQTPKQGPYGFELYETGPENARIETYRKQANGHTLVINCLLHDQNNQEAVCSNHSRLPNQNGIAYRLNGDHVREQLKDAVKVDAGFRALINSFTSRGDKK